MSTLPPATLLDLVRHQRYGVEYQPIVTTDRSETIYGYEALARFSDGSGRSLPPDRVFNALHDDRLMLFQVEYRMKALQIAEAPVGERLFLNLDPDAYAVYPDPSDNPFIPLISDHPSVVVEIIENSTLVDASISTQMAESFSGEGVALALDDIGAPRTLLSIDVLTTVDYLKLAREWLTLCDDYNHRAFLKGLLEFARATGKRSILEGVETRAHLLLARELGVDFVQGYLYRDRFLYGRESDWGAGSAVA